MPRYLKNRSSEEILAFLKAHGFFQTNILGDDAIYRKDGRTITCKVTLNRKSTPIGTMEQIKRCSGYTAKKWCIWWKENGFGE